jgi:hypothetical protein
MGSILEQDETWENACWEVDSLTLLQRSNNERS